MAILKFYGAESGDVEESSGNALAGFSIDAIASPNSGGVRSYKNDGTMASNMQFGSALDIASIFVALRFRGTWSSTPGTSYIYRLGSLFDINNVGLAWILLRHNSTGTNSFSIYLVNGGTSQIASSIYNFTLTSGMWLDVEYNMNANGGWIRLNGTQVVTLNSSNALWTSGTNIDDIAFMSTSASDTGRPMWVDDIVVADSEIAGNPTIIARQFNNTGFYNSWTVNSGTKAAAVSQTPYSAANYIYSAANSAKQTFTVNSFSATETGKGTGFIPSGGSVLAAKMGAVLRTGTASPTNGVDLIRRYNSSDNLDVGFSITTSDAYYDQCAYNALQYRAYFPSLAELNGAEYGVNHYYTGLYTQYMIDLWVHAVYFHAADFALTVMESGSDNSAINVFIGPTKTALAAIAGAGALAGVTQRQGVRAAVITSAGTLASDGTKITSTFLRPESDVALNGWTAINAATLYAALDQITADDTDYIQSPDPAGGIACEVGLSGGDITGPVGFWYRASKYSLNALNLTIRVIEGGAERAVRTRALTDAFVTYQETLTPAEIAAVTNWANVTIRFSAA